MKSLCLFCFLSLSLAVSSFAAEKSSPKLVSYGASFANVKDYYPGLTMLDNNWSMDSRTAGNLYVYNNKDGNFAQWVADNVGAIEDAGLKSAKNFCANRFSNHKEIIYGLSNFDYEVERTADNIMVYGKFDRYCATIKK